MSELLATRFYRLVEGRHGRFLANPQDIYIGRSVIEYGEFSEHEYALFDQILNPDAVVIEAGANMGALTVPIAKKVGTGGLVYAFEPQLAVFQQLCANLALNDLINVQAFNAGCAATSGWMGLKRPNPGAEANFGGLSMSYLEGEVPTRVRLERLDEALDPPRLDLLKADVEGMEVEVLKGAKGLIDRFRPILYLEANQKEAPEIIRHVEGLGYAMWWHLPPMFNARNFAGKSENLFGAITSKNIICTPKERSVSVQGAREVKGPEDHPNTWKS